MQISTSQGAERCYRLIDGGCEPHRELDAQYSSLDDAIADAIAWVEAITESNHPAALIGVEVSTTKGGLAHLPYAWSFALPVAALTELADQEAAQSCSNGKQQKTPGVSGGFSGAAGQVNAGAHAGT